MRPDPSAEPGRLELSPARLQGRRGARRGTGHVSHSWWKKAGALRGCCGARWTAECRRRG